MTRFRKPVLSLVVALTAGLFVAACSDSPTANQNSPLTGLAQREGKDSTGNPLPPPPTNPTPGSFHGIVLGPSAPGSTDTLATAPRIADVVVTAYPVTGGTQAVPTLGAAEQSVTAGADGKFQLTLSGGDYVVTFNPPASSIYGGVWVTASTSANSNDWPWWVVLSRK